MKVRMMSWGGGGGVVVPSPTMQRVSQPAYSHCHSSTSLYASPPQHLPALTHAPTPHQDPTCRRMAGGCHPGWQLPVPQLHVHDFSTYPPLISYLPALSPSPSAQVLTCGRHWTPPWLTKAIPAGHENKPALSISMPLSLSAHPRPCQKHSHLPGSDLRTALDATLAGNSLPEVLGFHRV